MGDVSHSDVDFGVTTIRNFFETSYAKGLQDGAGANLKHKADMAVIKRQVSGNYTINKSMQNTASKKHF